LRRYVSILFIFLAGLIAACGSSATGGDQSSARAYERHQSNVQVQGEGVVTRILQDDTSGTPHQKFILRMGSNQTVLIDHNIELAPRIERLKIGDTVGFSGEYVWNEQGGLVHWTHHDPEGKHVAGWLKHDGRTYQ